MNSLNFDNKTQQNLVIKLSYIYKKLPAVFLEIEFPKISQVPVVFDSLEYKFYDLNSNSSSDHIGKKHSQKF